MAIGFIFGGDTGETPESLKQKRALAQALITGSSAPKNVGEGLNAIGQALVYRSVMNKANAAQKAGQDSANSAFSGLAAALSGSPSSAGPQTSTSIPAPGAQSEIGASSPQSYRDAIASIESDGSGGYSAVGPNDPKMGRALGRYQIMEANIGPWSQETFGHPVSADEFLANPQIQDAIFDKKFGGYVQQYGPEGAAQAWFAGPGGVGKLDRRDSLGTSVAGYTDKFRRAIGGQPSQVASTDPSAGMSQAAPQPQAYIDPRVTTANVQSTASPTQTATQQIAQSLVAPQPGGANMQTLLGVANNPWLTDTQKSIVGALIGKQLDRQNAEYEMKLKQDDPAYQADLRLKNAQTDQIVNPRISPTDQANINLNRDKFNFEQQNSQETNDIKEYNFAKQNGYQGDFAQYQIDLKRAGAARTNVDTGTIPQGYQAIRDQNGNILRYDPIPGGPADTSKKDAAASDSKDTFTDVITNAANLARNAATTGVMPTTGLGGRLMAGLSPGSNAAEMRRQVGVLKSNATIENLNAMRQQSPTGGALGNVTEGEGAMLSAKAGALDPDSPNFVRDLDDYERTLLRIVHGKDAGDQIYNQTRQAPVQATPQNDAGAGDVPAGVSPDLWSVMTPQERSLWQKK